MEPNPQPSDQPTPSSGAPPHGAPGDGGPSLVANIQSFLDTPLGKAAVGLFSFVVPALLGVVWTLLNPFGKIEVTNRIERRVPISLPADVAEFPLGLQYAGKDIKRATLVDLEIRNTGSSPVGDNEKPWKLDLRSKDGSMVVAPGPPCPTPSNVKVDVVPGPSKDILTLEIGVLDKGDTIRIAILLIDSTTDDRRPVEAATRERMTGLKVVNTTQDIRERLRDSMVLPIWLGFFGIFLTVFGREQYQKHQRNEQSGKTTIAMVPVAVVVALIIGGFLAYLFAGGFAWVAEIYLEMS